MTAGQSAAGRDVESINEEAVACATCGGQGCVWCGRESTAVPNDPAAVDRVAALIRHIDGAHDKGAAAIAEELLPLLRLSDVPGLERQLRDKIAGETREFAEQWLYDGDRDRPLSGYLQVLDLAEQIARGSEVSS